MKWTRWLAIAGVIVIAALLAFPLREIVNQMIVLPLAYGLWLLHLLYISLHQGVWWAVMVAIVLLVIGQSLLPENQPLPKQIKYPKRERGNVESLAAVIQKSRKGMYYKWLTANRLGKLAHQILLLREHGKSRSVFAPLTGEGWDSEAEIQQYLEQGLHGSFADFPNNNWGYFRTPPKTPLDHDVAEVLEFLEARIESNSKPRRHEDTEKTLFISP